jgi:hypothetical protein
MGGGYFRLFTFFLTRWGLRKEVNGKRLDPGKPMFAAVFFLTTKRL